MSDADERWKVPANWKWKRADEFAEIVGGGTPKSAQDTSNYEDDGIPWLTPADLSNCERTYISRGRRDLSEKGFNSCSAKMLPKGSVLLSSRAPVGYCVVAANDICTNQGFKSFRIGDPNVSPEYLRYYLLGSKQYLNSQASGTTFLELSTSRTRQLKFPLAPPAIQEKIVSKIDELFSQIDEGERALKRVQTLIERYRQSVLKAAVTGELTRDWRAPQKNPPAENGEALLQRILKARRAAWEKAELEKMAAKGKTPASDVWKEKYNKPPILSDIDALLDLPDGWTWASMGQAGEVTGGLTKNSKRSDLALKRPYLRVANVYQNRLELDDVHEIGVRESEIDRVALKPNDLLVVEGNGSIGQIGRVALWDASVPECVHQNHLIKVRFNDAALAQFALVWCLSPSGRRAIERVASSTAGLHTLSISKVQQLPIPIPPESELATIWDRVERMKSDVDFQLKEVGNNIDKADTLRQAVLKSAFSGRLIQRNRGRTTVSGFAS